MQLNKQEIRNALYQGEATRMLNRIVRSPEFIEATGNAFKSEKRMKDKYLLNRFLAIYLYRKGMILEDDNTTYVYKEDIDELLGRCLDLLNQISDEQRDSLEILTLDTLKKSAFYMGEDAFRLNTDGRKSPINMNLFETLMYSMVFIEGCNSKLRKNVHDALAEFISGNEFRENIGNHRDSAAKLQWRLDRAEEIGRMFAAE
jgi:hypothetical protein